MRRRFMMIQKTGSIPSKFQRVDYLEGNKKPYIISDMMGNVVNKIEVTFQQPRITTALDGIFGYYTNDESFYLFDFQNEWGGKYNDVYYGDAKPKDTLKHTAIISNSQFLLDDRVIGKGSPKPIRKEYKIYLFARKEYDAGGKISPFVGRIFEIKGYVNNELKYHYLPYLNTELNKPCMYDVINKKAFYNNATEGDDFTWG